MRRRCVPRGQRRVPARRRHRGRLLAGGRDPEVAGLLDDLFVGERPGYVEGDRVGRYRIVEEIGRGGMGTVYLAERDDGLYRQSVAIKVLAAGGSEDSRRRFAREARILARLEHRGIARLLDAGVSEDGRPYLVMERVEGVPVDRFCRERGLDLDGRLDLMRRICDAIAYAHRRLILHRDIKPANVLVTESGEAKVLDFGIGALLEETVDAGFAGDSPDASGAGAPEPSAPFAPSATEPPGAPDDGAGESAPSPSRVAATRAYTPGFASPEQTAGDVVGVPSDVYQLGLLLRLLILQEGGTESGGERDSPADRRDEPLAVTYRRRSGARPEVARRLARGLDAVVARCLEEDPDRRYAGVDDLAGDLAAEPAGRPLSVLRHRRRHLWRSFLRRNRGRLAAAALVLLLLGATVVGYTLRLRAERDRTREALAQAEATNEFLGDVLLAPDVTEQGPEVRVLDVMDRAADTAAADLGAEPLVRGRILSLVGQVRASLGDGAEALETMDAAVAALEEADPGTARDELLSTLVRRARHLTRMARLEEAETALDDVERRFPDLGQHPLEWVSWNRAHAIIAGSRGDVERAIELHRKSLERLPADGGEPLLAARQTARNDLAVVLEQAGRLEEAEPLYRESLEWMVERYGARHEQPYRTRHNLGGLLAQMGRLEEAGELFRENVRIAEDWVGREHEFHVLSFTALANVLADQGDVEEAVKLDAEAFPLAVAAWGEAHPRTQILRMNAAGRRLILGRPLEAEELLRQAVPNLEAVPGPAAPPTLYARMLLAQVLLDTDRADGAIALVRESIRRADGSVGPRSPITLGTKLRLARGLRATGDAAGALAVAEEVATGYREVLGIASQDTLMAQVVLGETLDATGRRDEARRSLCATEELLLEHLGPDHPNTALGREALERVGGCP